MEDAANAFESMDDNTEMPNPQPNASPIQNTPIEIGYEALKRELVSTIETLGQRRGVPAFLVITLLQEIVLESKLALYQDLLSGSNG